MFRYLLLCFLLPSLIISCIRDPQAPTDSGTPSKVISGAYILCEGIWGMDNSSLTRYDLNTGDVINSFYEKANPTLRLGDLANNIVLRGDTAFIAMTTSGTIEAFLVSSGKSLGRLKFDGRHAPRKICIFNDTVAFVSDLYSNSILEFNLKTLSFRREILVGPAPEGIAIYGNYLFAANSGYGDYLADKPKAGTISIIDITSRQEIKTLTAGPDIIDLIVNIKSKKLYAAYRNLPSKKDSAGGIIEYDLNSLIETNRWREFVYGLALSGTGDSLFFLNKTGIACIGIAKSGAMPYQFVTNPSTKEIWYSIAVCPLNNTLWIGNAKNYQVPGEIIIYDINFPQNPLKRFEVGLNPNTIVFF